MPFLIETSSAHPTFQCADADRMSLKIGPQTSQLFYPQFACLCDLLQLRRVVIPTGPIRLWKSDDAVERIFRDLKAVLK